jgi:hypothetical protein
MVTTLMRNEQYSAKIIDNLGDLIDNANISGCFSQIMQTIINHSKTCLLESAIKLDEDKVLQYAIDKYINNANNHHLTKESQDQHLKIIDNIMSAQIRFNETNKLFFTLKRFFKAKNIPDLQPDETKKPEDIDYFAGFFTQQAAASRAFKLLLDKIQTAGLIDNMFTYIDGEYEELFLSPEEQEAPWAVKIHKLLVRKQ